MPPGRPLTRRAAAARIAGGLGLLALPGCAMGRPGQGLRVGVHGDPISLDPHLQNEVLSYSLLANLYDALTAFDAESRAGPGLAAWWENPDELIWLFHLRPEVRFHDGRSLQAADVVASLERARQHQRSGLASFVVEIEQVRERGPLAVEVRTRRPFAALLNKLAFIMVVPRDAPEQIAAPVGTGAYRLGSFERGRSLRLEPAPADWRGAAPLPLEFVPVPDRRERTERLLRGELDLIHDLAPADVPRVRATPALRVESRPSTIVEYLHLSPREPRFRDLRVRRALHLALDRQQLVARMLAGQGQPASQFVGAGVFGFAPDIPVAQRDVVSARRLLAEAGLADGFEVTLEYRQGRDGTEIARQLGEVGVRVTLRESPWADLFARLRRREVPFYYGGIAALTADASDVLDSFLHTPDEARGYGLTNFGDVSSPELDALIERSAGMLDLRERRGVLQQCMRVAAEGLQALPLLSQDDVYGLRADLQWRPRQDRFLLGREMRRA
jgi:peptide/nickel transport system substrate-binding protein